jgi:hypothetical protein
MVYKIDRKRRKEKKREMNKHEMLRQCGPSATYVLYATYREKAKSGPSILLLQ